MTPLFIDALSNKLKTTLPGWDAQKKMMMIPNRFSLEDDENKGKPASVLLLLYPSDKGWFFFLTIRSQKELEGEGHLKSIHTYLL